MDKKSLFWYVIVPMVGIFFFSSLALAQKKQKMEISKQLRERIIVSTKGPAPAGIAAGASHSSAFFVYFLR
jgi:hypothetical protein